MKKKIVLSLIISSLIIGVMPVFANEISTTDTTKIEKQDVTVDYTIGEKYTVIIPADMTLVEKTNAQAQKVEAKDVRLTSNKTLTVTMSSANNYRVNFDKSYINYMIEQGDSENGTMTLIADNSTTSPVNLFTVESGATAKSTYLKFYTTADEIVKATQAGVHEDKLTFSCEVK